MEHNGSWSQVIHNLFDAATPSEAEARARKQILWLKDAPVRMELADAGAVSLGAQLWEPCGKCGAEPSYAQPTGHLCARCAAKTHPVIDAGSTWNTTEPEERD